VPYEDDIKKLGRTLKIYNIDGKSIFQDSDTYIGGKPKVWMGKFLVQNISNVYFLIDPISKQKEYFFNQESKQELQLINLDERYFLAKQMENFQIKENYLYSSENVLLWSSYEKISIVGLFDNALYGHSILSDKRLTDWKKIAKVNLTNGLVEWIFDIENVKYKIQTKHPYTKDFKIKILGSFKNSLWLTVHNGCILELDITTGDLLSSNRDCVDNVNPWANDNGHLPILTHTQYSQLLLNEEKMICFHRWYYWELDLNTSEVVFHDIKNLVEKSGVMNIQPSPLIVEEQSIFFVDSRSKSIARFDRKEISINIIGTIPEEYGSPKTIEKDANHYYVYTRNKNLLVYKIDKHTQQ
jgi:predicted transcriptional regulator